MASVSIARWFFVAHKTKPSALYNTKRYMRFDSETPHYTAALKMYANASYNFGSTYRMKCVMLFSLRASTSTVRCIIFWILFECYILQMIVFSVSSKFRWVFACVYLSWSKRVLFHLVFIVYRDFFSICFVNCIRFDFFASRIKYSIVDGPNWRKKKNTRNLSGKLRVLVFVLLAQKLLYSVFAISHPCVQICA